MTTATATPEVRHPLPVGTFAHYIREHVMPIGRQFQFQLMCDPGIPGEDFANMPAEDFACLLHLFQDTDGSWHSDDYMGGQVELCPAHTDRATALEAFKDHAREYVACFGPGSAE